MWFHINRRLGLMATRSKQASIPKIYDRAIRRGQYAASLLIVLGVVLVLLGFSGEIEWIVEGEGFQSKLLNASQGVLFGLSGVLLLWRYKPKIEVSTTKKRKKRISGDNGASEDEYRYELEEEGCTYELREDAVPFRHEPEGKGRTYELLVKCVTYSLKHFRH